MEDETKRIRSVARAIARTLKETTKRGSEQEWEICHALRIPNGDQASRTAALIIMQALGQTADQHRPEAAETLRHWEHVVMEGSKLRFRPIVPLALRLLRSIPGSAQDRIIGLAGGKTQTISTSLAGREMQELGDMKTRLPVFHTRPESAALMAQLAVRPSATGENPGR